MVNLPDPREEALKTARETEKMMTDLYTDLCYCFKEVEDIPPETMERLRILAKRIEREQTLIRRLEKGDNE